MDPISEMFSQIKNAQGAQKESLVITYSKIKLAILEILKSHHQIADYHLFEKKYNVDDSKKQTKEVKKIEINLSKDVDEDGHLDIRRVSRPGRRIYIPFASIPRPKRPKAMVIISTSKGVLDGEEARRKGLGGEVIAEVR